MEAGLLKPKAAGMKGRKDEGFLLRLIKPLDDRVSVKLLLHVWGPRFEFFVLQMLVATFLDDSFRVATHFSEHVKQVGEQGYLKPLAETSPGLVGAVATIVLGLGLLAQSLGSLCLLANLMADFATKALIGYAILQPVLYMQLTNIEFVAQSLSVIGGLLILRAHLSEQAMRVGRRAPLGAAAPEAAIAHTQLIGRLLIPAVYVYHAGVILCDNLNGAVDHTEYSSLMLASEYAVNAAVLAGLALGCALVAVGLKSRTIALVLTVVNLLYTVYQHPFFSYVSRSGGEWKYDDIKLRTSMPHVAAAENLESWHIVDLHRYYFFQGLSTSGALLLLTMLGPGEIAVEEDEVLKESRREDVERGF